MVNSFLVRVPLLSLHRIVIAASSSRALSLDKIAFRLARPCESSAKAVEHTTYIATGIEATSSTAHIERVTSTLAPLALDTINNMVTSTKAQPNNKCDKKFLEIASLIHASHKC
jgi:hypothetical protein